MAYVRIKKIGSTKYMYLVKSVWDRDKKTSRQKIIKYMGPVSDIKIQDIPKEYRNLPKVREFLVTPGEDRNVSTRIRLYDALTSNRLDKALGVYEEVSTPPGNVEMFFDNVLRPVLYDIGCQWADGQMDIAIEHVASNVANTLIKIIRDRNPARRGRISVALCVPPGEKHHMGCDVLETYLSGRGFVVYNLGHEMPKADVMEFVGKSKPDSVAISVSGQYSIPPAEKMADEIADAYDVPILMGGYAFANGGSDTARHRVCADTPLRMLPRLIREAIATSHR